MKQVAARVPLNTRTTSSAHLKHEIFSSIFNYSEHSMLQSSFFFTHLVHITSSFITILLRLSSYRQTTRGFLFRKTKRIHNRSENNSWNNLQSSLSERLQNRTIFDNKSIMFATEHRNTRRNSKTPMKFALARSFFRTSGQHLIKENPSGPNKIASSNAWYPYRHSVLSFVELRIMWTMIFVTPNV